tara:strand:- start:1414 stop:2208 length:795 start_codon:yes stop_codon:yes gene_type:complete
MIGLIFGDTNLPKEILEKIKKKREKYLIIDLSKKNIFKKEKYSYRVSVGQFSKIINIIKKNNCKKVLLAGKIDKPNFSNIKLDIKGIYYMPRIIRSSKLGDAAILKEVIKILKKERIKTINSLNFNPELSLKRGNYSTTKPNIQDKLDIKKAIKTLNNLSKYNFSQGAVVKNNDIIAIEGEGGTQKMLKKCKSKINKKEGVLVKFPKKKQDLRVDLPTVGIKTFKQCKLAGIKGVVLKNKQNIFLERSKCIKFANKNKMFITVK